MRRKNIFISTIILTISIFLLSGCDSGTAKKIKKSIDQNDSFTAQKIYEDATKDMSKERKRELNKTVSIELIAYLQKGRKEIKEEDLKKDDSKVASFYDTLDDIEQIGIKDKNLDNKVKYYKEEIENKNVVENGNKEEEVTTKENSLAPDELVYVNTFNEYVQSYNKALDILNKLINNPELYQGQAWSIQLESESLVIKTKILELVDMENAVPQKYKEVHKETEEAFVLLTNVFIKLEEASKNNYNQSMINDGMNFLLEGKSKLQEAITNTEETYGKQN